jgi:TRAP-type C4-dicarboxylate transport system permease small subunit
MPPERSALAPLYRGCAALAGVALVAVFLLMIGETLLRKVLGGFIPGAGQLIAWSCCAAAFLAMPYAFRLGDFVRVDLAAGALKPGARRWAEALALSVMTLFCAFATWSAARYVLNGWRDGEMTQGMLEVPLWWAQASMVLGLAVLTLAVAECLIDVLRGRTPIYTQHELARIAAQDFGERV